MLQFSPWVQKMKDLESGAQQNRRPTPLLLEEGAALLDRREESVCYKVCCTMAPKGVELPCPSEADLQ